MDYVVVMKFLMSQTNPGDLTIVRNVELMEWPQRYPTSQNPGLFCVTWQRDLADVIGVLPI